MKKIRHISEIDSRLSNNTEKAPSEMRCFFSFSFVLVIYC